MPLKPTTSLTDLIGRRFDTVGLQFSHIIGVGFYDDESLEWLRPLLLEVNEDANFTVLPETERGSAILGVAAHLELRRCQPEAQHATGVAAVC